MGIFINDRTFKSKLLAVNVQGDMSLGNIEVGGPTYVVLVTDYKTAQAVRASQPIGLRDVAGRHGRRLFVRFVEGERRLSDGHFNVRATHDECRSYGNLLTDRILGHR